MERFPDRERYKSFDPMASIDLMRFDLQMTGVILPETMQRVCDEELTYIAEGINRPLYTEFRLDEIDGQIVFFDRGEWRPYLGTLMRGLETAKQEAALDPRKSFQVERAEKDLSIGFQMLKLRPGEKMVWDSPFPENALRLYGPELVSSLGYNCERRLGFIYQAEKDLDGRLILRSHSVDNSDRDAFEAVAMSDPNSDMHGLLAVYDAVMSAKYEADFYAGRQIDQTLPEENAWELIHKHQDLLSYYFRELKNLARRTDHSRSSLERDKKRLTYGVWAALKQRLDKGVLSVDGELSANRQGDMYLVNEVTQAYTLLSARGEVMFGCGGSIKGEDALLNASPDKVFDAIFGGNQEGEPLPAMIRCVNCNKKVPSKDVVKVKSWCCPKCKYEVDICTGAVLCTGNK